MTIYLIVTFILITIFVLGQFNKKRQSASIINDWNKNPHVQEMKELADIMSEMSKLNENGTDQDTIPDGYGEFGYELTNPIPVNTIHGNISYLAKLRTMKNEKVSYKRIGSFSSPTSEYPVDGYSISTNEIFLTTLYISPFHKKNSEKAPKDFILLSETPMPRIRKTSREIFVGLTAMFLLNIMLFLLCKIFTEITLLNCLFFSTINALWLYFLLIPGLEKYINK